MAIKKIQRTYTTAKTVYAIVMRDADGWLRDNPDGSFAAAPAAKYLPLAEHAVIKGLYEASIDDIPWDNGIYTIVAYDQAAGAPAPATDTLIDDEPQKLSIVSDAASSAPGTLLAKIQGLVKDTDAKLADADWQNGIAGALNKYSAHRPDMATVEIPGSGSHDFDLPAGWINDFSMIDALEYPVGQMPENYIDSDDIWIYKSPTGKKLRLRDYSPGVDEKLWLTYTILRTEATIVINDVDAVANLAASICLGMLASRYIGTGDSTMQADAVNYRTKSQEASSRAKICLAYYNDHMGVKDDQGEPAASAVRDLDLGYPGGFDRLTHPRRLRERR